jgi:hypothetical protein
MYREVVTQSFIYIMWDAIVTVQADPHVCEFIIHGFSYPWFTVARKKFGKLKK